MAKSQYNWTGLKHFKSIFNNGTPCYKCDHILFEFKHIGSTMSSVICLHYNPDPSGYYKESWDETIELLSVKWRGEC